MSVRSLFRLSAFGLAAGAVVVALASLFSPNGDPSTVLGFQFKATAIAALVGGVVLMVALPAMYLFQRAQSGVLGLVGMLLIFAAGSALTIGAMVMNIVVLPGLANLHLSENSAVFASFGPFYIIATAVVTIGGIVFGISVLRAKVYSSALGIGFIVLPLLSFALSMANLPGMLSNLSEVVYMIAFLWTGIELGLKTSEQTAVSTTAANASATA